MADNIPDLDDLLKSIQEEDDEKIPDGLEDLIKNIQEEDDEKIPDGLDDLLESISDKDKDTSEPPSSSALAVVPKKPEDLVEEEIDSQILSILGLEDVFDLTYEEYASLLKEKAVEGRMADSQMSTESIELVTNELKRVKGKTGSFKVKPKKVDINKVLDRKTPTPSGAIVKPQKLLPATLEPETQEDTGEEKEDLKEDVTNGIGDILRSLVSIRSLLQDQNEAEEESTKEDRKKTEKEKKKEREKTLEKKKSKKSPILKALTKPVDDFFGAIKKFFTNVILGSVVLGIFKWLKDPKNKKAIDNFTNFLENNAGLILGGLLAVAAVPLVSTILGFLAPITAIAIPAIKAAFAFLTSPVGLISLATLAGVAVTYKGIEYVSKKVVESGFKRDYGEGNVNKGLFITRLRERYGRINPSEVKNMTPEEQTTGSFLKIYDDALKERQKINDELYRLRSMSDDLRVKPKIQQKEKELKEKDKQLRQMESQISIGGKSFSQLQQEYESGGEAALPQTSLSKKLGQPVVQPTTPKVPGAQPSQTGLPALPPTNTLPGKQHYGAQRSGGRKHAGVDFDAGPNDEFYSRIGGEVTNIGDDPGGYYKYVDIYNPELNVTERIAEGDNILVRRGQVISPGTPVAKGTNTTGVFHYEIRKGKSTTFGFAGTVDPISFLGNPTTQTQVAQSPAAQVAPTSPPTPSIPSPTGRGNIVPIPIPTGGGAQQSTSGSGGNQTPVPRFSSEDPNNMGTMVIRSIYNIIG